MDIFLNKNTDDEGQTFETISLLTNKFYILRLN